MRPSFERAVVDGSEAAKAAKARWTSLSQNLAGAVIPIGVVVPLWYCVLCPTVLGLLFPLTLNFGCYWIAIRLCKIFRIPPDQQAQYFWLAISVAAVLSFASAYPIFLICRLQECAHRTFPWLAL